MDLITKRTHYACKDNFVVLDSIKTWTQYVGDNNLKSAIRKAVSLICIKLKIDLVPLITLQPKKMTRKHFLLTMKSIAKYRCGRVTLPNWRSMP